VASRSYDGFALDGSYQTIDEAPYWQGDGETVNVVDDRLEGGDERTENVPVPDGGQRPDVDGQSTLSDWGWS